MSVEEAILELLKVHNRVILPGFGAFLVAKDDSAEKPYVLFNGFLSFNDGLLVDYLADKNGVDSVVAADYATEYVFNLKAALQEEKIYKFNFLGTFDFEESGAMRFRYNPNVGRMPQKPGAHAKPAAKTAPAIETKKESKSEKKVEEKEPKIKSEPIKPVAEKVEAKSEPVKPASSFSEELLSIDNSTTPSVVIDSTSSSSNTSKADVAKSSFELEDEKSLSSTKEKSVKEKVIVKNDEPKNIKHAESTSESRGRATVAIVSVLLLLVFVGGYFYFYYFPHKAEMAARQEAMEIAVKQKEERIKFQSDSLAVIKERELALADSLNKIEQSSKTLKNGYHLIIGAFAEEKNADKLLSKIKVTFPKAQKIAYRGRFMVSVDVFETKDGAQNQLTEVTQTLETDCWIHRN